MPGPAAGLFPKGKIPNHHRAIERFAHVVDGKSRYSAGCKGLHFYTGPVDSLDLGLDLDIIVADSEIDCDGTNQKRMAKWNELSRLLGGLYPGNSRNGQDVTLADGVAGYLRSCLGLHMYAAACHCPSVCGLLGRDVDHPRTSQGVGVSQAAFRHGGKSTPNALRGTFVAPPQPSA